MLQLSNNIQGKAAKIDSLSNVPRGELINRARVNCRIIIRLLWRCVTTESSASDDDNVVSRSRLLISERRHETKFPRDAR